MRFCTSSLTNEMRESGLDFGLEVPNWSKDGSTESSDTPISLSPVRSLLPELYSTLRHNDSENIVTLDAKNSQKKWKGESTTSKLSQERELLDTTLVHVSRRTLRSGSNSSSKSNLFKKRSKTLPQEEEDSLKLDSHLAKTVGHIRIPDVFVKDGLLLMKVSSRSRKRVYFKIDASTFKFSWKTALKSSSVVGKDTIQKLIPQSFSKLHEFSLDDVKTISFGPEASNFREELCLSKDIEDKWVSIIHTTPNQQKFKRLHLIADTKYDYTRLKSTIKDLKKLRQNLATNLFIDVSDFNPSDKLVLDTSKQLKQFISLTDILKYTSRLNINLNRAYLEAAFNDVAEIPEKGLTFEEFRNYVTILKQRKEITEIFKRVTNSTNKMSYDMFDNFVNEEQVESYSEEKLQKIFKKLNRGNIADFWTADIFNDFLLSKYSTPLITVDELPDYYNNPLNEYFISSSHNTYLRGRQVAGDSSIEGYIKALQKGCKCVEVDVWDPPNESFTDPVVNHGRTFTNPISFSNVMNTIKKYAFITSPYPVIVSLEIHCSISYQRMLVDLSKQIFGDSLICKPLDDDMCILPSPMQLKYKVLFKVKKTSQFASLIEAEDGMYVDTFSTTSISSLSSTLSEDGDLSAKSFLKTKRMKVKIDDSLSCLGVYLQGLKFRNFSLPESKIYNHCFSLSENSINSMLKDEVKRYSLDKHNRKHFTRVYPSSMRMRSSNFIPLIYWAHGVQMVATNWQTYDLGQQLNESMFEGVKRRGYLLKPKELRKPLLKSSKIMKVQEIQKNIKFSIVIISAHHLPGASESSATNSFISLEILGADQIVWNEPGACTLKTDIVPENGFNPIWNHKATGELTGDPNLIFLRFSFNASSSSTKDSDFLKIGTVTCKLLYLKQGYRYLPIYDMLGQELVYSSLFVNIKYSVT